MHEDGIISVPYPYRILILFDINFKVLPSFPVMQSLQWILYYLVQNICQALWKIKLSGRTICRSNEKVISTKFTVYRKPTHSAVSGPLFP